MNSESKTNSRNNHNYISTSEKQKRRNESRTDSQLNHKAPQLYHEFWKQDQLTEKPQLHFNIRETNAEKREQDRLRVRSRCPETLAQHMGRDESRTNSQGNHSDWHRDSSTSKSTSSLFIFWLLLACWISVTVSRTFHLHVCAFPIRAAYICKYYWSVVCLLSEFS